MLSVVKMPLKREVAGRTLNGHGNYIVDHGKSWINHGIVFLNFCGNPDAGELSLSDNNKMNAWVELYSRLLIVEFLRGPSS